MELRRARAIATLLGLLPVTGCVDTVGDTDRDLTPCEVATHAPQPVDEPAQYLDFILTRTASEAEGRAVRMVTWGDGGQIIGAAETTVERGSYRFELDEGYERFSYQAYVVAVDSDGDGSCGAADEVYRGITSAWNPVDNTPYNDERPWFANPPRSNDDCAVVDRCTVPSR